MSEIFDHIPQDRLELYLHNAEIVINEATEPVIRILANLAMEDGVAITDERIAHSTIDGLEDMLWEDAMATSIPVEVKKFIQEYDMQKLFARQLDVPVPTVAEEAEALLRFENQTAKMKSHLMTNRQPVEPKPTYGHTFLTTREHRELDKLD